MPATSLIGNTYGRLTVVSLGSLPRTWQCRCSCGREELVTVHHTNLTRKQGPSRSCGCLRREVQRVTDHTRKARARVRSLSQQSLRSLCKQEDVDYKQVHYQMSKGFSYMEAVGNCKSKGRVFTGV